METAVGVSDPSLTLVEFVDGIGFFLAEGFQHDSFTGLDSLENVSLRKYSDHAWSASEHERVVLCWDRERWEEFERLTGTLGVSTSPWVPAVFFLTEQEYGTHRESLRSRRPEQVLRAAFASATKVKGLKAELSGLWSSQRDALERLLVPKPGRVQPNKETVRISLPPKPGCNDSISPSLPFQTSQPAPASLDPITVAYLEEQLGKLKKSKPPEDPPPKP
ncbi:MAG: hypothetical protein ABMA26_18290 [Limisphaerales bacterium]